MDLLTQIATISLQRSERHEKNHRVRSTQATSSWKRAHKRSLMRRMNCVGHGELSVSIRALTRHRLTILPCVSWGIPN